MDNQDPLLALGRLDGRLAHSPAWVAWTIRSRFEGAAISACNAGVPIDANHLEAWIAGSGLPPRSGEGRNDPLSVVAIVHYFLESLEPDRASHARQVRRLLGSLIDPEREAAMWANVDLVHYGPLWRALRKVAEEPGLEPSLASIGARMSEMGRLINKSDDHTRLVAWLPDGRKIAFDHDHPKAWLVYLMFPAMLRRSGLSAHTLPSLVPRQKFLCGSAKEWTATVANCIAEQAPAAHRLLCRMERDVGNLRVRFQRTKRSRLAEAAELRMALPSLTRRKLAIAVDATPAGAGYLMRQLER